MAHQDEVFEDTPWNGIPPPPPPPPPSSASPPTIAQVMAHTSDARNIDDYHGLSDNDPCCYSAGGEESSAPRSGNSHFRPSRGRKTAVNEADDVMGAADATLARMIAHSANADGREESKFGASPPVSSIRDLGEGGGGIQQLSLNDDDPHGMDGYNSIDSGFTIAAGNVFEKKPFLRKGSRREPSSLHRYGTTAGGTSVAIEAAVSPTSALKETETKKKQSLEVLEQMQQDQMDDLEKRMARRREAREQQERQKQQQQLANGGILQHQSPPTDPRSRTRRENTVTVRAPYATDDIAPPGTDATSTANDLQTLVGNEVKGLPPPQQHSGSNSKSNKGRGMASSPNVQRSNEKSKTKGGKRVPLRPRNSSDGTKGGSEEEKKRNDEQWALIKSMRRRQETALRDAEQEKETVHAWAVSERESVKKWADEQRGLIRREKHRASTAAMASQRERQRDEKKQQDTLAELKKSSKAEIDALRSTVERLRTEMEGTKARYRTSERKLREKLRVQSETIQKLKQAQTMSTPEPTAAAVGPRPSREKPSRAGSRNGSIAAARKSHEPLTDDDKISDHYQEDCEEALPSNRTSTGGNGTTLEGQLELEMNSENADPDKARAENHPNSQQGGDIIAQEDKTSTQDHILLEESTEEWVKRLEERHNSLPITTSSMQAAAVNSSTPTLSRSDDLLAKANQLMSGGNQRPTFEESSLCRNGLNDTSAATSSGTMYPVPQHTPDPHLANPTFVEGSGSDGRRIVSYRNGTSKEILPDGTAKVYFANGDVKTTCPNQNVTVYYYAAAQTTHTTYANEGLEVFEFSNKQTEKHYRDGRKEVFFADGTVKTIDANGSLTTFPDGVKIVESAANGTKQIIRG